MRHLRLQLAVWWILKSLGYKCHLCQLKEELLKAMEMTSGADIESLTFRLRIAEERVENEKAQNAILAEQQKSFEKLNAGSNRLAVFFRNEFGRAIEQGKHDRFETAMDAAIWYLKGNRFE